MKKALLAAVLVLSAAAAAATDVPQEPDPKKPVVCESSKPVKLFVSFVYLDQGRTRSNYGNVYMCWDKDVDTQEELMKLHDAFKPRAKGDVTTILSVMRLRK